MSRNADTIYSLECKNQRQYDIILRLEGELKAVKILVADDVAADVRRVQQFNDRSVYIETLKEEIAGQVEREQQRVDDVITCGRRTAAAEIALERGQELMAGCQDELDKEIAKHADTMECLQESVLAKDRLNRGYNTQETQLNNSRDECRNLRERAKSTSQRLNDYADRIHDLKNQLRSAERPGITCSGAANIQHLNDIIDQKNAIIELREGKIYRLQQSNQAHGSCRAQYEATYKQQQDVIIDLKRELTQFKTTAMVFIPPNVNAVERMEYEAALHDWQSKCSKLNGLIDDSDRISNKRLLIIKNHAKTIAAQNKTIQACKEASANGYAKFQLMEARAIGAEEFSELRFEQMTNQRRQMCAQEEVITDLKRQLTDFRGRCYAKRPDSWPRSEHFVTQRDKACDMARRNNAVHGGNDIGTCYYAGVLMSASDAARQSWLATLPAGAVVAQIHDEVQVDLSAVEVRVIANLQSKPKRRTLGWFCG